MGEISRSTKLMSGSRFYYISPENGEISMTRFIELVSMHDVVSPGLMRFVRPDGEYWGKFTGGNGSYTAEVKENGQTHTVYLKAFGEEEMYLRMHDDRYSGVREFILAELVDDDSDVFDTMDSITNQLIHAEC